MKIPFARRVFILSFVPVCLLLSGSFWAIQRLVADRVKDGLRNSLRRTHESVTRVGSNYQLQNSRMLAIIAENPSLKAGLELARMQRDNPEARRTLEDQLGEFSQALGFDLMMASDTEGVPLACVLGLEGQMTPIELQQVPSSGGLARLGDAIYSVSTIPVNLGLANIGSLTVGRVFDLQEFSSSPTVLSRGSQVLQSSLSAVSKRELEKALAGCDSAEECEVELKGETYLCMPLQNLSLGDGYVLRSLQSVDSASGPLLGAVRRVFTIAGMVAVLAVLCLSAVSSRSIVRPLTALTSQLREAEANGALPSFGTDSSIKEIDELVRAFNNAASSTREARDRLTRAYLGFIESMTNAIDARDVYTAGHSQRVSEYACKIARVMRIPQGEIELLRVGALLHDVGKIGVADAVLQKPGRLTPRELELIQLHPLIGKHILERVEGFSPYLPIVELHHENHDGSGYPWKLRRSEIPRDARILHVADAYDAMTSDRPYRCGMSHEEAVERLKQNAGKQFDPAVVAAFTKLSPEEIRCESAPAAEETRAALASLARAVGAKGVQAVVEARV